MKATDKQIQMFSTSLNTLTISYLGADNCCAAIMGLSSDSEEYKIWVKETMIFNFLPVLRSLILGRTGHKKQ